MEDSECDTQQGKQEKDPNQPRQNLKVEPIRGATSVAWLRIRMKSLTQARKLNFPNNANDWSPQLTQKPLTSLTTYLCQAVERVSR